jgi:hypothetical protein
MAKSAGSLQTCKPDFITWQQPQQIQHHRKDQKTKRHPLETPKMRLGHTAENGILADR